MIKNSEKREARAWVDEKTGRLCVEFMFPFDHELFEVIHKRSTEPAKHSDVGFDLVEEDATVWGIDVEI